MQTVKLVSAHFFLFSVHILPSTSFCCTVVFIFLHLIFFRVRVCAMVIPSRVLYEAFSTHKIKLHTLLHVNPYLLL